MRLDIPSWIFVSVSLNPYWCTYPVHLHVLKLQPEVIALYEVAPQENLSEEGLSKSFWLKETEKRDLLLSSACQQRNASRSLDRKRQGGDTTWVMKQAGAGDQLLVCDELKKIVLSTSSCILRPPMFHHHFWLVLLLGEKKNKTKIGCCVFSVIGPRTEGSRKITSRKCGEVYLLSAPGFVFTKRGTNYYVLRTHCTWGLEFEPVTFGENYSLKHLVVM